MVPASLPDEVEDSNEECVECRVAGEAHEHRRRFHRAVKVRVRELGTFHFLGHDVPA